MINLKIREERFINPDGTLHHITKYPRSRNIHHMKGECENCGLIQIFNSIMVFDEHIEHDKLICDNCK